MKKLLSFALLGILFVSTSGLTKAMAEDYVFPAPALNGPTGVVRIPSANVIPYKNFNVGMDYGSVVTSSGISTTETRVKYKMNLGTFHGVELGIVGGTDVGTANLREGVFVNMKLSLSTGEGPHPLMLAIGVENLFSYTETDVYMVATKYLKQGPKLTFGFMADFPNAKFRPMGMAGIEVPVGDTFFIGSDLMAGESLFQVNLGAKLYITPLFSVSLTGLNILDGTQIKDERTAYIGFSWANPF